jgi:ankyrin repeat protein/chemotaxis receptor (MCP) glutamine deamidase CheD
MGLKRISNDRFNILYNELAAKINVGLHSGASDVEIYKTIYGFFNEKNIDMHVREQIVGQSFLHRAAQKGSVEDAHVINLLGEIGFQIDMQDSRGNTPLYYASVLEKELAVTELLKAQANPNLGAPGEWPLAAIIKADIIDEIAEINIVKALIKAGANLNEQSAEECFSPLHLAIIHRKVHIVREIISSGEADLGLKDSDGATALHMVAKFRGTFRKNARKQTSPTSHMLKETEIAELIIQNVDAINIQDKWGNTALHMAVINSNQFLVELFLEKDYLFPQKKVLSIKNSYGMTVFHEAVRKIVLSPTEGKKVLELLMRVATQKDLETLSHNGETALDMVNRLISTPEIVREAENLYLNAENLALIVNGLVKGSLTNKLTILTLVKNLSENIMVISQAAARLTDNPEELFKETKELSDHIEALAADANEVSLEILKLIDADKSSYFVIRGKLTIYLDILTRRIKELVKISSQVFSDLRVGHGDDQGNYVDVLQQAKRLLEQSDYFLWKSQQLSLASSFTDYKTQVISGSGVTPINPIMQLHYNDALSKYLMGNYPEAIDQLRDFIQKYSGKLQNQLILAHAYCFLGNAYLATGFDQLAQKNIKKSINIYYELKNFASLESAFKLLAFHAIKKGTVIEYERTHLATLTNNAHNKAKLFAHVALAELYKAAKDSDKFATEFAVREDLITQESFHFSEGYKLTQGEEDQNAHVVLQRELGIAQNVNVGTYNLQQCVAAVVFDPQSKKVVLSHFDRFSGPLTFIKELLAQFPYQTKLDIYLCGGRDRTLSGKEISDRNIDQVLKQIYFFQDRFTLRATDLGDKPSPEAIIFDVEERKLIHRVPSRRDLTLNARFVAICIQIIKGVDADYLHPLNKVDFSKSELERIIYFTPSEKQKIQGYYNYYVTQPHVQSQLWRHNQVLFPFRIIAKEISAVHDFNRALLSHAKNHQQNPLDELLPFQFTEFDPIQLGQQSVVNVDFEDLFSMYYEQRHNKVFSETENNLNQLPGSLPEDATAKTLFAKQQAHQKHDLPDFFSCFDARKRRSANGCLILWKDIDKFNKEKKMSRDLKKVNIDSTAFISYLSEIKDIRKQSQLIKFANSVVISGSRQSDVEQLINTQKLKHHIQRLGKISTGLNQVLLSKNLLAEFLQENYEDVAINLAWIGSSALLSKLSEQSRWLGESQIYKGKAYLGSSLKMASPFIRRGTSAFIVYDLIQQINSLKSGDKQAIVGILSDSFFLGIDVAEIGIEVLEIAGIIGEISSFTGPIGEVLGLLIFLGSDIYLAIKKVEEINELIHLHGVERLTQGFKAFLNIPDQRIELQEYHSQLIRRAVEFLHTHPNVTRYVFAAAKITQQCRTVSSRQEVCLTRTPLFKMTCSSDRYEKCESCVAGGTGMYRDVIEKKCTSKFVPQENNRAFLQDYSTVLTDESVYVLPEGAGLFCSPEARDKAKLHNTNCENALGIMDLSKKTEEELVIIDLGHGDDCVNGFLNSPNLFFVESGNKEFVGGKTNDIFLMMGEGISGLLNGGQGSDTLNLQNYAPHTKTIEIYLNSGEANRLGNSDPSRLAIQGFERIIGRVEKADIIYPGCNTNYIDLQGGENIKHPDRLWFLNEACGFNITVSLNPNTFVYYNEAVKGNFTYTIPKKSGKIQLNFNAQINVTNYFITEYSIFDLQLINMQANRSTLLLNDGVSRFELVLANANANTIYRFFNQTEIRIGRKKNNYAFQITDRAPSEIINNYLPLSARLHLTFIIHSSASNEVVTIGSNNHEVIYNDSSYMSHLIGNNGENVYVIESGRKKLNQTDLPLKGAALYYFNDKGTLDTLILQNINTQIVQDLKQRSSFEIKQYGKDLYLRMFACNLDHPLVKREVITIQLRQGIQWYAQLHVVIANSVTMQLVYKHRAWGIRAVPLRFDKEKTIIIISPQDVVGYSLIQLEKKTGSYNFLRSGEDLWLTNRFHAAERNAGFYTIVLKEFYRDPNKLQQLSIQFLDSKLILADLLAQIMHAQSVTQYWQNYQRSIYQSVFSQVSANENRTLGNAPHNSSTDWFSGVTHFFGKKVTQVSNWLSTKQPATANPAHFGRQLLSIEDINQAQSNELSIANIASNETLNLLVVGILKITGKRFPQFKMQHSISPVAAQIYAAVITEKIECLLARLCNSAIPSDSNTRQKLAFTALDLQNRLRRALIRGAPLGNIIIDYIRFVYLQQLDLPEKTALLSTIKNWVEIDLQQLDAESAIPLAGHSCFYAGKFNGNQNHGGRGGFPQFSASRGQL